MSEEFFKWLEKHKTHKWARALGIKSDNTGVLAKGRNDSGLAEKVLTFFKKNWVSKGKFNPIELGSTGPIKYLFENPTYHVSTAIPKKGYMLDGGFFPNPDSAIGITVRLGMTRLGKPNERNVGLALKDICAYFRAENIQYEVWAECMGPVLTKWPEEK